MQGQDDQASDTDDEESGDELCDEATELEESEVTSDVELPAATGGVQE
jgi:hypothetical protein